jgi:hypothetical protein
LLQGELLALTVQLADYHAAGVLFGVAGWSGHAGT